MIWLSDPRLLHRPLLGADGFCTAQVAWKAARAGTGDSRPGAISVQAGREPAEPTSTIIEAQGAGSFLEGPRLPQTQRTPPMNRVLTQA